MKNFHAGKYVSQGYYSAFCPEFINHAWIVDDTEVINLLGQAERAIGKLDMFSDYIPNIDLFIQMHVVKEATQSTKIEGTQTNFEEALQKRDDIPQRKRDDWDEVQNYIRALNFAMKELAALPFSGRLIKEIHKILLQGVRGEYKLPGEYRTSQNWIGGASINDATFVPPTHEMVPEYISDIEKFAHNEAIKLPELLKIAIIHYQFETVHPFLDGNGRVGRLLIPIYLVSKGILKAPALYISDFFERHRQLYYDNLMNVRTKNDMIQWVKFFLVGVSEISQSSIATFDAILKLQRATEEKTATLRSKAYSANRVVDSLYQNPFTNAARIAESTNKTLTSAYNLIQDLERLGILVEFTGGKRDKQYMYKDYIDIFRK